MPDWLKFVDHTGDAGILVQAPDLEELFARAAWGMFCLITDVNAIRFAEVLCLRVEAGDRPALMVNWLSELNYHHATGHRLFGKFNIVKISETSLVAEVHGERVDPVRHTIFTEIKAVTFHGLRVERDHDVWEAHIIFDV